VSSQIYPRLTLSELLELEGCIADLLANSHCHSRELALSASFWFGVPIGLLKQPVLYTAAAWIRGAASNGLYASLEFVCPVLDWHFAELLGARDGI
jgi:hypothetical protein